MKNILMIGTGGTIASEMTPEGLTPELTPAQLLRYVPAISGLCRVDCLSLFSLDSTNITPKHWLRTAEAIREHYDVYDGFVISHGTDTMAYTAAALSYLVQGAAKPIMLTGAQKPINYDSTDSKLNLTDAFVCAASGRLAGVNIVFSGRVILGTRARKTCSKSATSPLSSSTRQTGPRSSASRRLVPGSTSRASRMSATARDMYISMTTSRGSSWSATSSWLQASTWSSRLTPRCASLNSPTSWELMTAGR